MRIDPLDPRWHESHGGPARKPGGEPTGWSSDRADLSRLSQALSGEVVSDDRIEQLRELVAEGVYEVPAAELSRRIVEAMLRGEE